MASTNGAALSKDQAVPYIVNFTMVDVNGDGNIKADEFKTACGKGPREIHEPLRAYRIIRA